MGWRLNEDVVLKDVDGQAVLLQLMSGQYYGLDEIGLDMLQTILAATSFDAAISDLAERYDTTDETLRQDAQELLLQLQQAQLVEHDAPS